MNINFWKISTLVLVILFILAVIISIAFLLRNTPNENSKNSLIEQTTLSSVELVLAEEIYPLFFCPCCGKPLDKNNICCGQAKERIDYIDGLVDAKISEEEVILAYVKKYGLSSFVDKDKQEEIREKLVAAAPADRPVISLNPDFYDFGDVSQKEEKVFTYFNLKNEGKSDLVIDKMSTSCGCTFASIVFKEQESPLFTMPGHGYENPEWGGVSIPAGETAQLKVMYDPDVHQEFRGTAIREVSVFSNDPIDFEKKVSIELNQVD